MCLRGLQKFFLFRVVERMEMENNYEETQLSRLSNEKKYNKNYIDGSTIQYFVFSKKQRWHRRLGYEIG